MLLELHIENFAVVERLRLRFREGLNLLTGETGSGKSIIVDSLGLLFGGRASTDLIRTGEERAKVSGIFDLPSTPVVRELLDRAGVAAEENELLIEREILANGKSRAFVGSCLATAALLKELSPWLGDIHGQNEQQQLHQPAEQREILDRFAGADRGEVASIFHAWKDCAREMEEIALREQEQFRLADLWSFQRKEIESVAPLMGEDTELENERRVLQNATKLAENAAAAFEAIYDAPDSAFAQARIGLKRVEELARIDESMREIADLMKPAIIALEEAGRTLRDYSTRMEADPERLESVESRLADIEKLRRKYGSSIEEILTFLDGIREKMRTVETASELRAQIEHRRKERAAEYERAASRLHTVRKQGAARLEKQVERELAALAMRGAAFRVAITETPWSETGSDAITFLISANKGEEPRELSRVASGGEVSRIALAIKTCVERERPSGAQHLLVFDEVDAGIGGDAAEAVGRRLKELSASYQVLCVTHQAHIASMANHHFRVEKRESKGRTVAAVVELEGEERTREIGRMLSGQRLTPEALKHAEQLLKAGAG